MPEFAEIVATPLATVVANPPLLIVATLPFAELQLTDPVTFAVLPSVYVPVAVNDCGVPSATVGDCGLMAIETSAALLTVSVVENVIAPRLAETVAIPIPELVTSPFCPIALLATPTVAGVALHVTVEVIS